MEKMDKLSEEYRLECIRRNDGQLQKFEKGKFYAFVRLRDTRIKTKPVTRVI